MDFDAAEDSFSSSPPQLGASGEFSLLQSSPLTEGPPSEQTNDHQVGTPVDSFEFSPATGMSVGDGEFLLVSHRRPVDEESLIVASPNELRREIGDDRMRSQEAKVRDHSHTHDEASRTLRSHPSNTSSVHDHSLVLDRVSDGGDAAWTDGHNDNNGLRKLSQSWPSRDEVNKSARNSQDINIPIVASTNDIPILSSPRAHESAASSGESRRKGVGGAVDGAVSETAGVEIGSKGINDKDLRPVEGDVIQNGIGEPLLGENLSVYSDGSSRGLPPPPIMPFSPLPAIGALRQVLCHF